MPDSDQGVAAAEALLVRTVCEAGALALTMFRSPVRQWTKGESSPVSEADIAVDALLHERLVGANAEYGWLSEETEDGPARLDARNVWIVDPIDGTRAYLAGTADWSISAALAVGGRPVIAAVFAPVTEELFLARAGGGATLNGAPMMAVAGDHLGGAKAVGPKRFLRQLEQLGVVTAPRIGSLALRLARVAQGALDLCIAGGNSHDWDLAAADLLVHEAGGALTTLAGEPLTYNRPHPVHGVLVAAGRARHAALLNLVQDDQAAR